MPGFSQRLGRVQVAASVAMTIKARELRAAGKNVITLTTGEPNFDSPPHAIEAAHQAALAGDTKYPPQDGTPAFKRSDPGEVQARQRHRLRAGRDLRRQRRQAVPVQRHHGDGRSGRRGGHSGAVLDRLCADDAALRGHAGVRQLSAEQRLQAARRGYRRGDHAEDQMAGAEQSEQSDRRGDDRRRHEGDRRGDAQASACLDPVRRHV